MTMTVTATITATTTTSKTTLKTTTTTTTTKWLQIKEVSESVKLIKFVFSWDDYKGSFPLLLPSELSLFNKEVSAATKSFGLRQ